MDRFRMDPELIDQAHLLQEDHHDRIEPHQRHPHPENKTAGDIPGPGLPQGRREIIMLGRMMNDVRSPEPAHFVGRAMEPVIGEIIGEETKDPDPPGPSKGEEPELVHQLKSAPDHDAGTEPGDHIPDPHGKTAEGILLLIKILALFMGVPGFDEQEKDETGNGIIKYVAIHAGVFVLKLKKFWEVSKKQSPRMEIQGLLVFGMI